MPKTVFGLETARLGLGVAMAIAFLASCGGGGGGSSAVPSGSSGTVVAGGSSKLTMAVTIPDGNAEASAARSTSSFPFRSSESVAPSIKGVAVFVFPAGTAMPGTPTLVGDLVIGASGSLCVASGTDRSCNLSFTAPVGNDTVFIKLYDAEPSGGAIPSSANLLATGSAAITVSLNGSNAASLMLNSVTSQVSSAGGPIGSLAPTDNGSISGGVIQFNLLAGAIPSGSITASVSDIDASTLPSLSLARRVQFVQGAGNTLIYSFGFTLTPAMTLNSSLSLNGTSFIVSGGALLNALTLAPMGTLNVAVYNGSGFTDVGTMTYSFTASSQELDITSNVTGTGANAGGIYIVYLPPATVASTQTPSPTLAPTGAPTATPAPTTAPTAGPSSTPTPTPTPTASPSNVVAKISVVLAPPNLSNFYPTYFATDPKLKYLALGNAAPISVIVTALNASGGTITGTFSAPVTLSSSGFPNFGFGASVSSMTQTLAITAPGTYTLQYNGSGTIRTGYTTSITAGSVLLTAPASISAVCISTSSTYEKGQEGNGPDVPNDAAGCG